MNKKLFLAAWLCLTPLLVLVADCQLQTASLSGAESKILRNSYIYAEVVPATIGTVAVLKYLPLDLEITTPFTYEVEKFDLIPDFVRTSSNGARIFMWGEKTLATQEMEIVREIGAPELSSLELFNQYYQGTDLRLTRTVSLQKGRAALCVELQAENGARAEKTFTLWDNVVVQLDSQTSDEVLIPTRGNVEKVGKRGVQFLPQDGIFRDGDQSFAKEIMAAPVRNWIARRNPASKAIFVVRTELADLQPDGLFYSWKQKVGSPLHTMELIFNPVALQAGEKKNYRLEYLFFAGLPDLDEVCGDVGIFMETAAKQLRLQFSTVVPNQAKRLRLWLRQGDQQPIALGERELHFQGLAEAKEAAFDLPKLPSGSYTVQGSFSDEEQFTLLKQLIVK